MWYDKLAIELKERRKKFDSNLDGVSCDDLHKDLDEDKDLREHLNQKYYQDYLHEKYDDEYNAKEKFDCPT